MKQGFASNIKKGIKTFFKIEGGNQKNQRCDEIKKKESDKDRCVTKTQGGGFNAVESYLLGIN